MLNNYRRLNTRLCTPQCLCQRLASTVQKIDVEIPIALITMPKYHVPLGLIALLHNPLSYFGDVHSLYVLFYVRIILIISIHITFARNVSWSTKDLFKKIIDVHDTHIIGYRQLCNFSLH